MQKMLSTLTFLLICNTIHADTINIPANKDNTLYQTTGLALSNGSGDYLFVGRTAQGENDLRRGLLQFDLSGIPNDANIISVVLEITSSRTISGAQTINMHKLTQDWGEGASNASGQEGTGTVAEPGDATWTNAFEGGASWNSAGGDYDPSASASVVVSGLNTIQFQSANLITEVENWLLNPAINFGWILIGNEGSPATAYRFNSRENPTSPPQLIIDYSLPQLTINPSKDNTLYETIDGSVSNGAGNRVFIGKPNNGLIRRGVMEFDVSSIPATAIITSVSLDLTVIDTPAGASNGTAFLHLALDEWGAAGSDGSGQGAASETGDATWLHTFYDTNTWNSPGGDFIPTASASSQFTDVTTVISFNSTTELIADVTTWVQNSDDNHGWVIMGDETLNGNVRSVGSLENATALNRPILTIEYFIPTDLIFMDGFE